ncbi:hypothetical protein WMF30_30300 [Sorangium sp. So ce134]
MQKKLLIGMLAFGAAATPAAGADADNFVYTDGPNYVDTGGTRCVVASAAQQGDIYHRDGSLEVSSLVSGNRTVFCPIARRSTGYYLDFTASSTAVSVDRISIFVNDPSSSHSLSCTPFAKENGGSLVFGATKYACSTLGGCSSDPGGAFTGPKAIFISNPISTTNSVQWGFSCSLPPDAELYGYEGVVNAN